MARVTVEDCMHVVNSRFELVLLAAQRVRTISGGAEILVKRDNDKNAVIALREIAAGLLNPDDLRDAIVKRMRRAQYAEVVDLPEDVDITEMMAAEMANLRVSQQFEADPDDHDMHSEDDAMHEAEDLEDYE